MVSFASTEEDRPNEPDIEQGASSVDLQEASDIKGPRSILRQPPASFPSLPSSSIRPPYPPSYYLSTESLPTSNPEELRALLDEAIEHSQSARQRAIAWLGTQPTYASHLSTRPRAQARLLREEYFARSDLADSNGNGEREWCAALPDLKGRNELVNVWEAMLSEMSGREADLVDPWEDEGDEAEDRTEEGGIHVSHTPSSPRQRATKPLTSVQGPHPPPIDLPITFTQLLTLPLPSLAFLLASTPLPPTACLPSHLQPAPFFPLLTLLQTSPSARHALHPYRWAILASTPETTIPGVLGEMIPLRALNGGERWMGAKGEDARKEEGVWGLVFQPGGDNSNEEVELSGDEEQEEEEEEKEEVFTDTMSASSPSPSPLPLSEPEHPWGSTFFHTRIDRSESIGLLDLALDWTRSAIQRGWDHPAHLALPTQFHTGGGSGRTFKEREEELVLLVGMAYRPNASNVRWNGTLLRALDEKVAIKGYLWSSPDEVLVRDIKTWVVPFLRWRARLAGSQNSTIETHVESVLHSYILELPLLRALPIFESSKATLPQADRVIRSDVDVVRMALAMLYGSSDAGTETTDRWRTMSRIFECMPMWDLSARGEGGTEDEEVASTTLESLAAFVAPNTTDRAPGPNELWLFFRVLGFGALSKALDILDVHLECGEILSKWGVSAPLRVFLITGFDKREQRDWAVRMARSAGDMEGRRTTHMSRSKKDEFWLELLADMGKLSRRRGQGAFGLLTADEVQEVFFDGLLSAGNFDLGRRLLNPTDGKRSALDKPIPPRELEALVLRISNEFLDNASTGNVHTGEMKLASECLSVAHPSPAIRKQQEFIHAISKLSSYHIDLTPLQIRLTANKLDLLSLVLVSNQDAYRQRDTLMDLFDKLGAYGDVRDVGSEVTALGMVADKAIAAGDFEEACVDCDLLIERMSMMGKSKSDGKNTAWKTFLALGTQTDHGDVSLRLGYIGRALEACPTEELSAVLVHWRRLEDARIRLEDAARHRRKNRLPEPEGSAQKRHRRNMSSHSVVSDASADSTTSERFLGSRTAARAARVLNASIPQTAAGFSLRPLANASAHLPNILRPASGQSTASGRSTSAERAGIERDLRSPVLGDVDEIRQQARKALHRGVGWLLGADGSEAHE